MALLTTAASLLMLVLGHAGRTSACELGSWSIRTVAVPANPSSTAYTQPEALENLQGWGTWTNRYLDPVTTTFSCVDSRGTRSQHLAYPSLSTPGGDMSELTALIIAYHRVKGTTVTEASVRNIFNRFMRDVATSQRPFYFHTDDSKLQSAFDRFQELTGTKTSVIPMREPRDPRLRDAWYEVLTNPDYQGCGHIRLMMQRPGDFDLATPAEAATPRWAIRAFFRYWWGSPDGSEQRRKVFLPILQGGLNGRALAIVNSVGPTCPGLEPDLVPFHGGSTMFIYQSNAVDTLRAQLLIPFLSRHDPSVNSAAVLGEVNALQGRQLSATLRLLSPLNTLPVYQANVTTRLGRV